VGSSNHRAGSGALKRMPCRNLPERPGSRLLG
jgi:hypothetical protein